MELNKQSPKTNAELENLAKEKSKLLSQLGVKIRKRVYNLGDSLAFVEDHPSVALEFTGAELEGEVEMSEIAWEKMKVESKTHTIELNKKGKKIVGYRKGSKKVVT